MRDLTQTQDNDMQICERRLVFNANRMYVRSVFSEISRHYVRRPIKMGALTRVMVTKG